MNLKPGNNRPHIYSIIFVVISSKLYILIYSFFFHIEYLKYIKNITINKYNILYCRASMIWIIGEYAERIDNADELLESFLDGFQDENTQVLFISLYIYNIYYKLLQYIL